MVTYTHYGSVGIINNSSFTSSVSTTSGNETDDNFLDEVLVKRVIDEDIKSDIFDDVNVTTVDDAVKYAENPNDWIYQFDYNKSHPFDNKCHFPVIRHGKFLTFYYSNHLSLREKNQ